MAYQEKDYQLQGEIKNNNSPSLIKVTVVNFCKRKTEKIKMEQQEPRRTQRDVLKEAFAERGITNHIQSVYYSKLGTEVANTRNRKMKELFPPVDGNDESDEWKIAYSLVSAYLKDKKMELTSQSMKDFIKMPPPSITESSQKINYEPGSKNIKNLVRDQKVFLLLNPDDFDFDLPRIYYQNPNPQN